MRYRTELRAVRAALKLTPSGKLGVDKLTPEEQRRRFIEAAPEAGASEDDADYKTTLKRIARLKKPAAI